MKKSLLVGLLLTAFLAQAEDRRAPGFSLPDINMKQHDLQDYRGKVVIMELMQTTCPNCQVLSGVLEKLKVKYSGRVEVVSVVAPPDSADAVKRYIAERHISSPILFDCGQVMASYLRITPQNPSVHFPHLMMIDGQGTIRQDLAYKPETQGTFTEAGLSALLEPLLKAKK